MLKDPVCLEKTWFGNGVARASVVRAGVDGAGVAAVGIERALV